MIPATCPRGAAILNPDRGSFGRPGRRSLPYGFHDEANDHRQSHAAAHRPDDDGCDFTCGEKETEEGGEGENRALRLGGLQMRTDQRRAPSTTLQQMERNRRMSGDGLGDP